MKRTYPVLIRPQSDGYYLVELPDFENAKTQGEDLTDALEMAEDLLGMWALEYEDRGRELPEPSAIREVEKLKRDADDIVAPVVIDVEAYRRMNDSRAVRKNCTIPSWLNVLAEKSGVNFSAVLQEGLKRELNLL